MDDVAESGNAITVEELQIRITAEYGDAIRQMLKMVEEVRKVLAAKLEPIADDLTKKIDSMKPATDTLSKTMSTAVKKMDGMSKTAARTSEQLEKLQKASEGFRDIHFEVPESDDFIKDLSRISAGVKRAREDMVGLNRAYSEHIQLRARLNGLRNAAAKQRTPKSSIDDIVVPGKTLEGIIANATRTMDAAKKKAAEMRGTIHPGDAQLMVKTAAGKINNYSKPVTGLQKTEIAVKNTVKSVQKIETAAKSAGQVLAAIPKVLNSAVPPAASLLKYSGKFMKFGLSNVLGKMRNSFSGLNKNLRSFAGNIRNALTFGLIYKAINAVSDALRTGVDNLYQYSKTINGTFAASMDRLSASMQYFKNSVGAAVSPIITALTPAIDTAVDHIVDLTNSLNQLIAKLSGASTWTKAVKVQKEYAESAEQAAEAQKGMLAGFDQLNVIQQQNGGGSSGSTDYSSMFEEVPLDGYTLPDFVQQMKDRIEQGDWSGVGRTLGEKVNAVVQGINWAAAGGKLGNGLQKAIDTYNGFMETVDWSGIGSGLGESLNNLMANVDFESAGTAFAQGWNALVELIHGFVTTTDWRSVGLSIAGFINGWFDTVDWMLLGQTMSDGVKFLLEALRTAVQNTDWKSIGGYISEALNQINWSGIFSGLAGLASDGLIALYELISGFLQGLDWQNLGTELWDSIWGIVTNIDYTGIVSAAFEYLGSAIGAAAGLIQGLATTAWEAIVNGFTATKQYFDKYIEDAGGDVILGVFNGILNALKNVGNWIKENIFTPIIEGFKNAFGIASPAKEMIPLGSYIILGMLEGFRNSWNSVTTWITTSFNWIKTKVTTIFTEVKKAVVGIWEGMWNAVKGVINTILGGIEKFANGIVKGINKVIDTLNSFDLDVPAFSLFGKEFGGTSIGFSISKVSEVSLPRLASGAVITSPTLGLMGEYPSAASNPEIVTPQKLLYETVTSANAEQNALLREQNNLLRQLLRKENSVVLAPSAALGRVNQRSQQMYEALAGGY